jgi:predicted NBD/HSP70 family sugar kinase
MPRSTPELVLTALRTRGPMSRAGLARFAAVAPSTVSAVAQDLIEAGLVVTSPHPDGAGRPGRPGLNLTLNPKLGVVAGALAAAGLGRDALIGAGVSVPGPVSRNPDEVRSSPILPGWHGVTGKTMAAALGVQVSIDNDSNLAALGEHLWGAGRGCDDSVTLKFHFGIGCGLFANGALVRGSGGAGELGHVAVDERGPLCRCGKRGCLETYAAIPAIVEALRPQHGDLALSQLLRLLAARDPGAVRVVGDAAELIGTHLAAVCNLLAPQRVIVVGPMARAGELVLEPIRAAVRRRIAPSAVPEVVLGTLGNRNTTLGAVALALDESDWLPAWRTRR